MVAYQLKVLKLSCFPTIKILEDFYIIIIIITSVIIITSIIIMVRVITLSITLVVLSFRFGYNQ